MIIRGGENLFPKEIEDFLNTHENILEAHVVCQLHLSHLILINEFRLEFLMIDLVKKLVLL